MDETFYFDCCGREIHPGQTVHNVGDAMEVILYCSDHVLYEEG